MPDAIAKDIDSNALTIRRVKKGDGQAMYDIFVQAVHTFGLPFYTITQLDAWTSGISPQILQSRCLAMTTFVAVLDGVIVGFGSLDPKHSELDFLYVHPRCAGKGIGRRIVDKIESAAKGYRIDTLLLTASLNAVIIYERLGYVRVSEMKKTIGRVTVPCVRMKKTLS